VDTEAVNTPDVRDAAPGDEPTLARLFRRASLSNPGDRAALLAHPDALDLPEDLVNRGRTRVAMLPYGTVVGFASTRPTHEGVLELDDLFVDPDWMRRGVARELVLRLVAEASHDRAWRLEVTANPHALDFYQAVGFVIDGRADTEFASGHRMHLDLSGAGGG